jgi:hypothetical protein
MVREEAILDRRDVGRPRPDRARDAVGLASPRVVRIDDLRVMTGALRMEFGPGGAETLETGPGDFLYVAPGAIHRESNPSADESRIIVVRAGSGEPVFNVDGPETSSGNGA